MRRTLSKISQGAVICVCVTDGNSLLIKWSTQSCW